MKDNLTIVELNKVVLLAGLVLIAGSNRIFSSESMDTSYQLSKKGIRITAYSNNLEKYNYFSVQTEGVKILDENGKIVAEEFSSSNTEYKCKGGGYQEMIKVVFNPFSGLVWWGKIGISKYYIDIPTNNGNNFKTLNMSNPGSVIGAGLRRIILPDTIVSPALSMGVEFTSSKYYFDLLFSDDKKLYLINNDFQYKEIQADFLISKKYAAIEPYGGFKVKKNYFVISEKTSISYEQITGSKEEVNIFAGMKVKISNNEYIIAEGNFVGETILSMGIGAEF